MEHPVAVADGSLTGAVRLMVHRASAYDRRALTLSVQHVSSRVPWHHPGRAGSVSPKRGMTPRQLRVHPARLRNWTGHLFIAHGAVTTLAYDAWALPTDAP